MMVLLMAVLELMRIEYRACYGIDDCLAIEICDLNTGYYINFNFSKSGKKFKSFYISK